MKVNVGSKNPVKVGGVAEVLQGHPDFAGVEVISVDAGNAEFEHPHSLQTTVDGAIARAKAVFNECDYAVGIESGLIQVPHARTGHLEVTVCAMYDGTEMRIGMSSGYEWPQKVTELILNGMDGSQALREAGFTDHPKIGTAEGGIWLLTHKRVTRKDLVKQAVEMALVSHA